MAKANIDLWSTRLLRALNISIILGSIAFLTFEIQFEPNPAEFGWSLIMIAIITMLSGVIGCVSSSQTSCFFPHMFLIFVSLMGLFSLAVLLFVRPDEVARKMLAFHISLSGAMHHLLIDAYFFSLLGVLQLLTLTLAYVAHKSAHVEFYEDFENPFPQPPLISAEDSIKTSATASDGSKQETIQSSSPSLWIGVNESPLDHTIYQVSSGGGGAGQTHNPPVAEASTKQEEEELQKRLRELLWRCLRDLCMSASSSCRKRAEGCDCAEVVDTEDVVELETSVTLDNNQEDVTTSSLPTFGNLRVTSSSSNSPSSGRRACSTCGSTDSLDRWSSSSSLSPREWQFWISKESDLNLVPICVRSKQQSSSPEAVRLYLIALILRTFINLALARFKPSRIRTRVSSAAVTAPAEMSKRECPSIWSCRTPIPIPPISTSSCTVICETHVV